MTNNTILNQLKLITLTMIATPVYIVTVLLLIVTALTVLTTGAMFLIATSPMKCYDLIYNYYEDRKKFSRTH